MNTEPRQAIHLEDLLAMGITEPRASAAFGVSTDPNEIVDAALKPLHTVGLQTSNTPLLGLPGMSPISRKRVKHKKKKKNENNNKNKSMSNEETAHEAVGLVERKKTRVGDGGDQVSKANGARPAVEVVVSGEVMPEAVWDDADDGGVRAGCV